jgi:pyridinium-3,5-biscarboxylic acid mononucleotide sulfurtransferase
MLSPDLEPKRTALADHLRACGRLLVAYSGGVDSAYLAYAAHEAVGDDMLAVLADSPSLARSAREDAVAFATEHRIPLRVVTTDEMDNTAYVRNDSDRCFHCKDELFTTMETIRESQGYHAIAYGMNLDDCGDFRPGQLAAQQHHVMTPLVHAGLTKADVRQLAHEAGLRVWDKPASACLASRIEYGRPVTVEALSAVERSEELLRTLGFRVFRVRHHGDIARIEIAPQEMMQVFAGGMLSEIIAGVKDAGFKFVTLDLEGYRTGSMNAMLSAEQLATGGTK